MYIDWQRSSLIIGDKAVSYYKEVMPVQGDVESYSSSTRQYGSVSSYSRGSFIGEVQMSKGIEFIPLLPCVWDVIFWMISRTGLLRNVLL